MGHDATALQELFPADTKDEVWIPEVGSSGMVIVTIDHMIRLRPAEREALKQSHATAFFLSKSFLDFLLHEQVSRLIALWPKLDTVAIKATRGSLYSVQLNGKIQLL